MTTIFTGTVNADKGGDAGCSLRSVFSVSGGSLDQIRVTFHAVTTTIDADHCSVGVFSGALGGTNYNTVATPVELTFNSGLHGFSGLTAGQSITSDWVTCPSFTSSDHLVVVLDLTATGSGGHGGASACSGFNTTNNYRGLLNPGATYNQAAPTGFSVQATGEVYSVSLVEVQSLGPSPTTLLAGSATSITSGTASSVATGTAPIGSLLVCVLGTQNDGASITGFNDSVGNSYTIDGITGGTSFGGAAIAYCLQSTAAITTSTTWTATTSSGNWVRHGFFSVSGFGQAAEGVNSNGTSTSATSASISTGTLGSNSVIAFAHVFMNPQGTGGGTVNGTANGFTSLFNTNYTDVGYKIQNSSNASIISAPTWTATSPYVIQIIAFDVFTALLNPATLIFM